MAKVIMYKPELETMPRDKLVEYQVNLFRKQMAYVYERSSMYKRKFDEAGIRPEQIETSDDVKKVPFTTKEELRQSQEKEPPFGDFLCTPPEEGVRVFQTTGTTGIRVRSLLNKKDWFVHYYEQFMHFMYGYGITTADTMFVPFNYGLYLAWWGIQSAFEQAGVLIIPGGGQSSEDRIKNILEWKPTVVCGTPTYILFLGDIAQKMGVDLSKTPECGRTFLRLDGGIIGRADDMLQFGGVNIFPSAIENFLRETKQFSTEYQIVAPKMGEGKHLRIRIEPSSPTLSPEEMDQAVKTFKENFKYRIGVTPDVEVVKMGELPRFEGKARRIVRK